MTRSAWRSKLVGGAAGAQRKLASTKVNAANDVTTKRIRICLAVHRNRRHAPAANRTAPLNASCSCVCHGLCGSRCFTGRVELWRCTQSEHHRERRRTARRVALYGFRAIVLGGGGGGA